jgi:hypothetical protein
MQAVISGSDGVTRALSERDAFKESVTCWAHIGYVSMHHYLVKQVENIRLDPGRRGSWAKAALAGYSRDSWEWFRLWDASIRLMPEQLLQSVSEGLESVALWQRQE